MRVRPGREDFPMTVLAPKRNVPQWGREWSRPIPYVIVRPFHPQDTWRRRRQHYREAEDRMIVLAKALSEARPTQWVDVLDVTDLDTSTEAPRIICRIEPRALILTPPPQQESLL